MEIIVINVYALRVWES